MKNFGLFLALTGIVLLLVAGVGHWTAMGNYESAPPRKGERFDPELGKKLDSYPKLIQATRDRIPAGASEREAMDHLFEIVTDRFTHKEARHTFFSNWLLYLGGKVHPTFAHMRDPNLLVAKGHSLLCDQSSYVLMRLAMENEIRARHVGLDGHVVMEAWYDSDWHLYDPDLEVVPLDPGTGEILSVEELALNQELLEEYYGPHEVAHIVGSRENNTYVSYPEGARFEWKSNVLAQFERVMEVVKFLLPILFVVVGLRMARRRHER